MPGIFFVWRIENVGYNFNGVTDMLALSLLWLIDGISFPIRRAIISMEFNPVSERFSVFSS